MAAFFSRLLPNGTTTTALRPNWRAAKACDCPWFPRVAEITPFVSGCVRRSQSMYTIPPRTLKAPTGVWFSCFIHTSHPARWLSRGHEYCGVGGTNRWTSSAADSSSAKEGSVGTVATGMWIRCTVGQIGHIFEDLPNPSTTGTRSEEHTSELQSQSNLVCRLL